MLRERRIFFIRQAQRATSNEVMLARSISFTVLTSKKSSPFQNCSFTSQINYIPLPSIYIHIVHTAQAVYCRLGDVRKDFVKPSKLEQSFNPSGKLTVVLSCYQKVHSILLTVNHDFPDRTMIVRSGVTGSCLFGSNKKSSPFQNCSMAPRTGLEPVTS